MPGRPDVRRFAPIDASVRSHLAIYRLAGFHVSARPRESVIRNANRLLPFRLVFSHVTVPFTSRNRKQHEAEGNVTLSRQVRRVMARYEYTETQTRRLSRSDHANDVYSSYINQTYLVCTFVGVFYSAAIVISPSFGRTIVAACAERNSHLE